MSNNGYEVFQRTARFHTVLAIPTDFQLLFSFTAAHQVKLPSLSWHCLVQEQGGWCHAIVCLTAVSRRPQHPLLPSRLALPHCDTRETFLMSPPRVPLRAKGRRKCPRGLWFGRRSWALPEAAGGWRWARHSRACGSAELNAQRGGRKWYGSRGPRGNWIEQLRLTAPAFYHVAFPGTF